MSLNVGAGPASTAAKARHRRLAEELAVELAAWNPRERMGAFKAWHRGALSLVHLNVVAVLEAEGALPMGRLAEMLDVSVANTVGHLYAFDDTCTHRGCSLAEAELDGTTITCICHGSRFDVTSGALLRGPAERPIGTYPVREEGGDLQIEA